jgi:hypothetical protein
MGQSWTIQCEILEQQLIAPQAADEEHVPALDNIGSRGWSVLSTESHASWGSTEYWSVASQHVEDRSTKKEKILTDL